MMETVHPWLDCDRTFSFFKGRVALHAILEAARIGHGDEVVMPGFTCVVVPAAVRYRGATPRFYDIDIDTFNGDPGKAVSLISDRTRAVIVQHNFGYPCNLGDLVDHCRTRGILLIEDCAHAVGASWNGHPVGTLGDAAFCSLQWSKPATTGLGGIALINDPALIEAMRVVKAAYSKPSLFDTTTLQILSWAYNRFYQPWIYWWARSAYRAIARFGFVHGSSSDSELTSGVMPTDYRMVYGEHRLHQARNALNRIGLDIEHRRRTANDIRDNRTGIVGRSSAFPRQRMRLVNNHQNDILRIVHRESGKEGVEDHFAAVTAIYNLLSRPGLPADKIPRNVSSASRAFDGVQPKHIPHHLTGFGAYDANRQLCCFRFAPREERRRNQIAAVHQRSRGRG